jgi:surfeit locus 1 family protein
VLRRIVFPVVLGIAGCAVLVALGTWQLRRLEWKEAILAEIEAKIAAVPVALPEAPDPGRDGYLPVTVSGALGGEELHVLTSQKEAGPGYRVISVLTAGERRVMVDLGFVPEAAKDAGRMAEAVTVTGNLHWPDETDGWTPAPDAARGIWFARDVPAMAAALGTEQVLVVAREVTGSDPGVTPWPIDTAAIPNDHREYAITWFSLAAVWAAMAGLLAWRAVRPAQGGTV